MNKSLYIIPGLKETCRRRPYQALAKIAEKKGYTVVFKNVDWNSNLSPQIFDVPENAVIFGFSLGAVLAWLVAQNNSCSHLILGSMTPLHCFKGGEMRKALVDLLGANYINDIEDKLKSRNKSKKQTIIYGDKEEEAGDILVLDTEHEITANYLKEIEKLL